MVAIQHLIAPASLPVPSRPPFPPSLSVLSWNVLLPNSVDAWWTYKMYNPPLTPHQQHVGKWPYRRDLLRARIAQVGADVVCLQEVAPASFEQDFAFMWEDLGYDGVELFRKGRFRPATFWRTSSVALACPPVHRDRTLLTSFRHAGCGDVEGNWHVLNCHLQAGKEGGRRVRQIHEGVGFAVKTARKLGETDPNAPRLVVCGDFNGGSECGAVRYLEDGAVGPDFLEDGDPVTSKVKRLSLSIPMQDAMDQPSLDRVPPPTLVVQELISLMVEPGTEHTPNLSADVLECLDRCYDRYATHENTGEAKGRVMGLSDVKRWLTDVNLQLGRGSEFRAAAKEMGWTEPPATQSTSETQSSRTRIVLPEDAILTNSGFRNVYEKELRQGKFWGIAHDLAIMEEPLMEVGVFQARYDRMYYSSSLDTVAIIDSVCDIPCPNDIEPSDHLPLAATFSVAI
mmetsp:Transcript_33586/g.77475  ORF Transcript_33586/g.77475 Transcript_33586/m.77475 type:complete len:455 (-) Transcript_33586:300-1664(-)